MVKCVSSKKDELDKDTNAKERAAYLKGDVKSKTKEELYEELVETIKDYNLERIRYNRKSIQNSG